MRMVDMAGTHLSLMSLAVLFFHSSEYVLAMWFHGRENVTLGSLLITKQYLIAMALSYLEYSCEARLFPWMKEHRWITMLGIAMVVIGEIVRKTAIVTAGMAFTHLIRTRCDDSHMLVTHGVYGWFRHPGYLGFLVWSVGTQVMLCNPVSTLAFAIIVWRFFYKRIPYEEQYLRTFFRSRYSEYAQRVPSGLPFLS